MAKNGGLNIKRHLFWLLLGLLGVMLGLYGALNYFFTAEAARQQAVQNGQRAVYDLVEQHFQGDFPYGSTAGETPDSPTPAAEPPSPSATEDKPAPATAPQPTTPQPAAQAPETGTDKPAPAVAQQEPVKPAEDIAPQSRWQRLAAPFSNPDRRPIISVVIVNAGLSESHTRQALELPAAVTLALSPYPQNLSETVTRAKEKGFEIWLTAPMEPPNFPYADPGDKALLTTLTPNALKDRLTWLTRRIEAVGLAGPVEEKFTAYQPALEPVFTQLRQQELLFLRSSTADLSAVKGAAAATQFPALQADLVIDNDLQSSTALQNQLAKLEAEAKNKGYAIGIARSYPITVEVLQNWSQKLAAKGFALAPLSAVMLGKHPGKVPHYGG